MTTLREAATRALEVLIRASSYYDTYAEIAALQTALAEHYCDCNCTWLDHAAGCVRAEPVEPVAWQWLDTGTFRKKLPKTAERCAWNPLYAAPQRKPLTDDQLDDIAVAACKGNLHDLRIAIEQAHGIKEKT